jgi:hypothetical protein
MVWSLRLRQLLYSFHDGSIQLRGFTLVGGDCVVWVSECGALGVLKIRNTGRYEELKRYDFGEGVNVVAARGDGTIIFSLIADESRSVLIRLQARMI